MPDNKTKQETEQERQSREAEELYQRKKAGKAGRLWSIEVLYHYEHEAKRYMITNLYSKELMRFRETVITAGVMIPTREEKGEYIIVLPWHIITLRVTRQSRFFEPG